QIHSFLVKAVIARNQNKNQIDWGKRFVLNFHAALHLCIALYARVNAQNDLPALQYQLTNPSQRQYTLRAWQAALHSPLEGVLLVLFAMAELPCDSYVLPNWLSLFVTDHLFFLFFHLIQKTLSP